MAGGEQGSEEGVGRRQTRPAGKKKEPGQEENYFFCEYFFLNRSTRPSVSTIFCVPVKNGWQTEQISIRISGFVDRVFTTDPHAQAMVASLYSGWMPFFTQNSFRAQ